MFWNSLSLIHHSVACRCYHYEILSLTVYCRGRYTRKGTSDLGHITGIHVIDAGSDLNPENGWTEENASKYCVLAEAEDNKYFIERYRRFYRLNYKIVILK